MNKFLCVKNGDKLQTSVSFRVRVLATPNMGSTKEQVIQDQRVALSSGIVKSFEGVY